MTTYEKVIARYLAIIVERIKKERQCSTDEALRVVFQKLDLLEYLEVNK